MDTTGQLGTPTSQPGLFQPGLVWDEEPPPPPPPADGSFGGFGSTGLFAGNW